MQTIDVPVLPDGRMNRRNAAKYLGCEPGTLANWAVQGSGPRFIKRGRVWYFKRDLDQWLESGSATSTASARLRLLEPA